MKTSEKREIKFSRISPLSPKSRKYMAYTVIVFNFHHDESLYCQLRARRVVNTVLPCSVENQKGAIAVQILTSFFLQ